MKTIAYIILIAFLSSCDLKSADDYFRSATIKFNNKNYREALNLYSKAIVKDNKKRQAYLDRGLCYEALNQIDSAILNYNKLLRIDKNNVSALYYIGICKTKQNMNNDAHYYFTKALAVKGFNDSTVSVIMDMNKDFIFADKMESFDIPSYEIFYDRGIVNYNLNKIKSAYFDFNRCIENNYNLGKSYYMIGLCWLASNNKQKACESLNLATYHGDSLALNLWHEKCR